MRHRATTARRRLGLTLVAIAGTLVVCIAQAASSIAPGTPRSDGGVTPAKAGTLAIPHGRYQSFFRVEGVRKVTQVPAFRLDAAPVTRGQFREFVRTNPEWRRSQVTELFAERNYLADWRDDLDAGGADNEPVTFVSWFAARAYCTAHNERLPSVAEWERVAGADAARMPQSSPLASSRGERRNEPLRFAMGTPAADLGDRAIAVGNVWEWNADFNSALVAGSADGRKSSSLFCGDGYRSTNAADYGAFLRYSFRASLKANYTLKNLGFRCAQDGQ